MSGSKNFPPLAGNKSHSANSTASNSKNNSSSGFRQLSAAAAEFNPFGASNAASSSGISFGTKSFSSAVTSGNSSTVECATSTFDAMRLQGGGGAGQDYDPSFYPQPAILHPQLGVDGEGYVTPHINQLMYEPGPISPLNHHLYAPPLPHVFNLRPNQRAIQAYFIPEDLRIGLTARSEAIHRTIDPQYIQIQQSIDLLKASLSETLPSEVNKYHSLYPLEERPGSVSKIFGYPTHVYKAVSSVDGGVYALRRIEGFKLLNESHMAILDQWTHFSHTNIVNLREAFTTKAFNDDSLIFVYDFHPNSETLFQRHFVCSSRTQEPQSASTLGSPTTALLGSSASASFSTPLPYQDKPVSTQPTPVTEPILWSYVVQLVSAIKIIHAAGLSCRVLDPTKILVSGQKRIRINGLGVLDLAAFDGGLNIARYQQEDLLSLGQLILCLACNSLLCLKDIPESLDFVGRTYSKDMRGVIWYLLGNPGPLKNIDDILSMLAPRMLFELSTTQQYEDTLEDALSRELENGRLVRLLCKLGFINERPEFEMDPHWSETGDRYLLKLFRDYVFHQVDSSGKPIVDIGHVLRCLNKLDTGSLERIMLTSRDEQSCLVVSYKDLKRCIDSTFSEFIKKK